jgi:hypothetical protein
MIHRDELIQRIANSLESMLNENLAQLYNEINPENQAVYDQDDLFILHDSNELTEADKATAADIAEKWEATKRVVEAMSFGVR